VAQSVAFRPDPWGLASASRQPSAIRLYYGLSGDLTSPPGNSRQMSGLPTIHSSDKEQYRWDFLERGE